MSLKQVVYRMIGKKIAKKLELKEDNQMEDKKKWWKSKGVWSGVLSVALAVYASAREPLSTSFGVNLPVIPEWLFGILGGAGIYGRAVANTQITK